MSERWVGRLAGQALTLGVAGTLWWAFTGPLAADGDVVTRFNPADGTRALARLLSSGEMWPHIVVSLRRLAVGLGLATAIGIPLGAAIGWWRSFDRATGPLLQLVRMVSPLSWAPIAITVLGIGDRPVYFLVAIGAVWPIALSTAAGVRSLDPGWLLVARSLGASRRELLRTIVAPGVRPQVLTGTRVALGIAWIILVPAEMLGVTSGLGFFVLDTRDRLAYDELVAAIMVIGVLGMLLDGAVRRLGARAERRVERISTSQRGLAVPAELVPEVL